MNHIMLPGWNGEGEASTRYADVAMHRLLERMLVMGCRQENLVAKVFGGASLIWNSNEVYMIGERNAQQAFSLLKKFGIDVVAQDVGGQVGRKIMMNTRTGVVMVARGRIRGHYVPSGKEGGRW